MNLGKGEEGGRPTCPWGSDGLRTVMEVVRDRDLILGDLFTFFFLLHTKEHTLKLLWPLGSFLKERVTHSGIFR